MLHLCNKLICLHFALDKDKKLLLDLLSGNLVHCICFWSGKRKMTSGNMTKTHKDFVKDKPTH